MAQPTLINPFVPPNMSNFSDPGSLRFRHRKSSQRNTWIAAAQSVLRPICMASFGTLILLNVARPATAISGIHALNSTLLIGTLFAQVFPPPATIAQGTQVNVNGQLVSAAWSQRGSTVGIADLDLVRSLGVELLDSRTPGVQPVQWFSQPTSTPIVLPTWLEGANRYLDIVPLAQHGGWQVEVVRGQLQITTPPSAVVGLRQGRQEWGDRIVIDLNRPASWQVVEQNDGFTVTIEAQTNPVLVQNFLPTPGNQLTSIRVSTSGDRTTLQVGAPTGLRPYVWSLPNPDRIVIDLRPDFITQRDILWAPGVRWRQRYVNLGSSQFPVVSLDVNLRQPGLVLRPILSNPTAAAGTAPLVTTAQRWQAFAAINGGFFNRNNQLPLGAVRREGQWHSGPILGRGAIAWNDTGEVAIGRFSLQDTIVTSEGRQFPILFFNTGYVGAGLAIYSSDWGTTYTPILDAETVITVQGDRVTAHRPGGAAGQTPIPIPADGYLIVARSYQEAVNALPPGTILSRTVATVPGLFSEFPEIMGAGPLLISDRRIVLNAASEGFSEAFIQQAAPRSVIGTTAEGTLILATVHNRVGGRGPTLQETAQLMQQLGLVHALNLDGGSSTSLYLGGQLLNRSPRTAARVHNGIGLFMTPTP